MPTAGTAFDGPPTSAMWYGPIPTLENARVIDVRLAEPDPLQARAPNGRLPDEVVADGVPGTGVDAHASPRGDIVAERQGHRNEEAPTAVRERNAGTAFVVPEVCRIVECERLHHGVDSNDIRVEEVCTDEAVNVPGRSNVTEVENPGIRDAQSHRANCDDDGARMLHRNGSGSGAAHPVAAYQCKAETACGSLIDHGVARAGVEVKAQLHAVDPDR